jgi:cell filamentation protein
MMTTGGYIVNKTFSKDADPYIGQTTQVLLNKLGIKNYDELREKECSLLKEVLLNPEVAKGRFITMDLLRAVHRYYFKDIYNWAGEFRTIKIFKIEEAIIPGLSLEYSDPKWIEHNLSRAISDLNSIRWQRFSKGEIAEQLAMKAIEIWKIHPFRDGNTRATLGFVQIIAIDHECPMDMSVFTNILSRPVLPNGGHGYSIRDMFLEASLPERPDTSHLIATFKKAMKAKNK